MQPSLSTPSPSQLSTMSDEGSSMPRSRLLGLDGESFSPYGAVRFERSPSRSPVVTMDGKKYGRNLVVCIDGTGNSFGRQTTNVLELHGMISRDRKQLTFYRNGLGTYVNESHFPLYSLLLVLQSMLEMALAWNVGRTVIDAYEWLSQNYKEGDAIYLFGFSRGAYQVRLLSSMIGRVGLVARDMDKANILMAYKYYRDQKPEPPSSFSRMAMTTLCMCAMGLEAFLLCRRELVGWFTTLAATVLVVPLCVLVAAFRKDLDYNDFLEEDSTSLIDKFKADVSNPNIRIRFIGCWDTVASVGAPWAKQATEEELDHVDYFRHALALDECRVAFRPEFVREGSSADVKEVWFPGAHSDVGGTHSGSHSENAYDNSYQVGNPALDWMINEAADVGLKIKQSTREYLDANFASRRDTGIRISDSLNWGWFFLELLPWRPMNYETDGQAPGIQWRGHAGAPRSVRKGQFVHISATSMDGYHPKAKTPRGYVLKKGAKGVPDDPLPPSPGRRRHSTNLRRSSTWSEKKAEDSAEDPSTIYPYIETGGDERRFMSIDSGESQFGDGFLAICKTEASLLIALLWVPPTIHVFYAAYQLLRRGLLLSLTGHIHNIFWIAIHVVLARLAITALRLDKSLSQDYNWLYEVNDHIQAFLWVAMEWSVNIFLRMVEILGRYLEGPTEYLWTYIDPVIKYAKGCLSLTLKQVEYVVYVVDRYILSPWYTYPSRFLQVLFVISGYLQGWVGSPASKSVSATSR